MPEMPLVTPGPAVSAATPGRRCSLATASAANTADCSCRTSSSRTPVVCSASYSGNRCPPESVNTSLTPYAAQRREHQIAAVTVDCLRHNGGGYGRRPWPLVYR